MAERRRGLFIHAKIHPKHLHSNSTSHTWPFSAMAELIDNAYDPDVDASVLHIDKHKNNGKDCLVLTDNGNGMDVDHLVNMLSLGFCEKEQYEKAEGPRARKPLGRFGNGFKSGSMRLANDALVFTVSEESGTGSIGFLSQTLCKDHNYETLILPIMDYQFQDQGLVRTPQGNMDDSLAAILDVSPYNDEDALKEELWILKRQSSHCGTKIVLFNLKRNKDGQLELDFVSDPEDIRNPETHESDQTSSQQDDKGFQFKESLRTYCSILYLAPKLTIFIRGKKVKTQSLIGKATFKSSQEFSYKPKKTGKSTNITFGYRRRGAEDMLEDYGVMFYYRNRLIEPYVKLKSQPPTSSNPEREVSGVVDVGEVLEPTHTKQEFQKNTSQYRSMMKALDEKLKEYLGRTSPSDEEEEEWLECCQCRKNRKLTPSVASTFRETFCCKLNPDKSKNRCDIPEEPSADANRPPAGNRPDRQGNRRGRTRSKTSDGSTARRSTAESADEDEQGPSSSNDVTTPSTSTATKRKSATPSRPPSSKRLKTATRSPSLEPAAAQPTAEPGAQVSPSLPQPRIIPVREHTRTIGATGSEEQTLEKVVARATKQIAKTVFKNTASPKSSPGSKRNTAASTSRSGNATVEGTHSGATASTSQATGNSSDTSSRSISSGATSSNNPQAATSNTNSTSGINRSATESANSSNVCNTGDSAGREQAQRTFKESVFKLLGLIIPYVDLGDLPGHGSEEEIETTVENMIKYIERKQN